MDNLMTYESFFSKLFKKKKKIFIPDYDSSILGDVKPNPELNNEISDILTELDDNSLDWRITASSEDLDKSGKKVPHYKSSKTISLLVIDILRKPDPYKFFHSNQLVDAFYHLESYLKKEWELSIFEIYVWYPYTERKMYSVVHSVEEFEKIDQQVYEVAIKFVY